MFILRFLRRGVNLGGMCVRVPEYCTRTTIPPLSLSLSLPESDVMNKGVILRYLMVRGV